MGGAEAEVSTGRTRPGPNRAWRPGRDGRPDPRLTAGTGLLRPDPAAGCEGTDGSDPAVLRIDRSFAAGNLETRAALIEICAHLAAAGLDDDDLGTVELVLAEVLNNIVEHSYGPDGGPVRLRLELTGACLACEVIDHGGSMPGGQVPQPVLPPLAPPAPLPEGGFGWHIVRCLVSELAYDREPGGNRLRFTIPLGGFG